MDDEEIRELLAQATAAMLLYDGPIRWQLDIQETAAFVGLVQLALRHESVPPRVRGSALSFLTALIEKIDPDHGAIYSVLRLGFDPKYDGVQDRLAGVANVDRSIVEGILEEVERVCREEGLEDFGRLYTSTSRRERLAQIVCDRRTK